MRLSSVKQRLCGGLSIGIITKFRNAALPRFWSVLVRFGPFWVRFGSGLGLGLGIEIGLGLGVGLGLRPRTSIPPGSVF